MMDVVGVDVCLKTQQGMFQKVWIHASIHILDCCNFYHIYTSSYHLDLHAGEVGRQAVTVRRGRKVKRVEKERMGDGRADSGWQGEEEVKM